MSGFCDADDGSVDVSTGCRGNLSDAVDLDRLCRRTFVDGGTKYILSGTGLAGLKQVLIIWFDWFNTGSANLE